MCCACIVLVPIVRYVCLCVKPSPNKIVACRTRRQSMVCRQSIAILCPVFLYVHRAYYERSGGDCRTNEDALRSRESVAFNRSNIVAHVCSAKINGQKNRRPIGRYINNRLSHSFCVRAYGMKPKKNKKKRKEKIWKHYGLRYIAGAKQTRTFYIVYGSRMRAYSVYTWNRREHIATQTPDTRTIAQHTLTCRMWDTLSHMLTQQKARYARIFTYILIWRNRTKNSIHRYVNVRTGTHTALTHTGNWLIYIFLYISYLLCVVVFYFVLLTFIDLCARGRNPSEL